MASASDEASLKNPTSLSTKLGGFVLSNARTCPVPLDLTMIIESRWFRKQATQNGSDSDYFAATVVDRAYRSSAD
jgi:hypothetical protein